MHKISLSFISLCALLFSVIACLLACFLASLLRVISPQVIFFIIIFNIMISYTFFLRLLLPMNISYIHSITHSMKAQQNVCKEFEGSGITIYNLPVSHPWVKDVDIIIYIIS